MVVSSVSGLLGVGGKSSVVSSLLLGLGLGVADGD